MADSRAIEAGALDLTAAALLEPTSGTEAPHLGPDTRLNRLVAEQSRSLACPGICLSVHTELHTIEAEWLAFEAVADGTAFQTFEWAATWQRHIGSRTGTQPVIVIGRDAQGEPMFIIPLAIERRPLARRLTWLGSELCDYNGPLLAPHFAGAVRAARFTALWDEMLRLVRASARRGFDVVDLQRMPAMVGGQPNPFMVLRPALHPSGAHLANLVGSWESFYAARRSAPTRKRERRQFKRLEDFGAVRFVEPTARQDIERTLETLFAQKAGSFARMGVENFLARPGYREFFHDLATSSRPGSLTHVSRLEVGQTMAATSLGLEFHGRFYLILSGYQEGEFSRHGPGRAHLQELLRRAIGKGLRQFDFTVGDEPYKRDWSDVTMPLYGHFAAATPFGLPTVLATAAFRRVKRTIKQNPDLWRLFSQARERLARRRRKAPQQDGSLPIE